jgi:glycosyltransferase involved in cell wall biosynthesis
MKVLHISKYYPPVLGGIESVTWELVQGLNRQGTATDVLCANQRPRTVHEQSGDHGVTRAASMGTWLSTSMAPALLLELRRLLARRDLIHVHMPDPMAALAVWACRPQVPVVVHWHSDVIRQRMALRLYEPLQTWLLARADAVIATSPPYAESSPPLRPWRFRSVGRRNLGARHRVDRLGHRLAEGLGIDVLADLVADLLEFDLQGPGDCGSPAGTRRCDGSGQRRTGNPTKRPAALRR